MSHVCKIELEIRDLRALAEAARALGLELVEDQQTYRWWGHSEGDYPLPAGMTAVDLGKCDHAIRIPGDDRAYEIGVVKRRDGKPGYSLLWDFYNGGFGMEFKVGKDGARLKQEYAAAVSIRQMRDQGFMVSRKVTPDGRIILNATR